MVSIPFQMHIFPHKMLKVHKAAGANICTQKGTDCLTDLTLSVTNEALLSPSSPYLQPMASVFIMEVATAITWITLMSRGWANKPVKFLKGSYLEVLVSPLEQTVLSNSKALSNGRFLLVVQASILHLDRAALEILVLLQTVWSWSWLISWCPEKPSHIMMSTCSWGKKQ